MITEQAADVVSKPPFKNLAMLLGLLALAGIGSYLATSSLKRAVADRIANPIKPAATELNKDFAVVPEFSLIERSERKATRDDFLGRVSVFGFVFTSCPSTCKMVTGVMARLRSELPREVRMASVSVDPINDTPAVLREYARQYGADADAWWFLTGDRNEVYDLIRNGFKLEVHENPMVKRPTDEPITHSSRLALVDKRGRIRGYYDASDPTAIDALKRRAVQLIHATD